MTNKEAIQNLQEAVERLEVGVDLISSCLIDLTVGKETVGKEVKEENEVVTLEYLRQRVSVFEDSDEIAKGLMEQAEEYFADTGRYAYWSIEGATHIEGLWLLVGELMSYIKENDNG